MHDANTLLRLFGIILLLGITILLIRRGQHREFRFFFIYVIFSIIAAMSRQIASGHPIVYFVLYWSAEAIYAVLALMVIREVFHHVLSFEYRFTRWARFLLPVTVIVIFGVSVYQGIHSSAGYSKILYLTQMIHWFDFGVHAFQAGLLVLLIVVCSLFSVPWLRYEFGIIIGFGINAVFTMAADLLWVEYGSRVALFSRYGPPAGYILATLMWLLAFSAPAKQGSKSEYSEKEMLELLREQWRTLAIIRKWLRRNRPLLLSR